MKHLATILALFAFLTTRAAGDSFNKANELGVIVGSEKFCELTFNEAAIATWIEQNVAADDTEFATLFSTIVSGVEFSNSEKTGSVKIAHCTQIRRTAKALGFIE